MKIGKWVLIGFVGLFGMAFVAGLLGLGGDDENVLPTEATFPTQVVAEVASDVPDLPTETTMPTETDAPTATAMATDAPTNTVVPSATAIPSATNTPAPTTDRTIIRDETRIESAVRGFTDVRMPDVTIADGRANGGERIVIVSFLLSSPENLALDVLSVTLAVYDMVIFYELDLDAMTLVWGETADSGSSLAVWQIEDVVAYGSGQIDAETFVSRGQ